MGQPMPLPERIPRPRTDKQAEQLAAMGLTWCAEECDAKTGRPVSYVQYTLPDGWRMVDRSRRSDLPDFAIVDSDEMIRITIAGSWKGTYDNELRLRVEDGTARFMPETEPMQYEPSGEQRFAGRMAQALDPQRRPAASHPSVAERHDDYVPQ